MSFLEINPELCTGCGLCEIMCSYNHKKVFSRNMSSIEIIEKKNRNNINIILHKEKENGHLACDECTGLDEPLCVKYCFSDAIEVKLNE